MEITRLPVNEFESVINSNQYNGVIFGSKKCPPCIDLEESISKIEDYDQIRFWEFHVHALGAKKITRKYKIKYMPRTIFFKNGKVIGKLLFSKTTSEIKDCLNELYKTGRVLYRSDDVEEITKFHEPVRLAMNIVWENIPKTNWEKVCRKWQDTTMDVIKNNKHWSIMTVSDIKEYLKSA